MRMGQSGRTGARAVDWRVLAYCSQDPTQCPLVGGEVVRDVRLSVSAPWRLYHRLVNRGFLRTLRVAAKNQSRSSGSGGMAGDRTVLMHSSRSRTRTSLPD